VIVTVGTPLKTTFPENRVLGSVLPVLAVSVAGGGAAAMAVDHGSGDWAWLKDSCIGPYTGTWKQQFAAEGS